MSKALHIHQIDKLDVDPLYVLIAGGIGSGKNHVVREFVSRFPVMDVDDIMEANGWTDYSGHHFHEAMDLIGSQIHSLMDQNKSLIAMGTSSHLPFTINKLYGAKMRGYKTVLLYVDAPLEQCIMQNEERRRKGKRFVGVDEIHKIARTNSGAALVAATLKDTDLVDYYCHHQNIR